MAIGPPNSILSVGIALICFQAVGDKLASADTLHVPGAYPTIQDALGAANHGDEIVVADGNYSGPGFRDLEFGGLRITLRSASGDPALCTLDCQQSGRAFDFDNDETAESIVEGFTIAYGFMLNFGGAMYIGDATPTIRNCVFYYCYADFDGGAVYVEDESPSFVDCQFLNNFALGNGGGVGIQNGSPSFNGCTFQGNTAYQDGGGAYINGGSAVFTDCSVLNNSAAVDGGGVYLINGSPSFTGCVIQENTTYDDGGGMYVYLAAVTLDDCTFRANAGGDGGGGLCYISVEDCTISGSSFADNEGAFGGAIYVAPIGGIEPTMTLENCSFTGNTMPPEVTGYGGGVYVDKAVLIANDCVFTGNEASDNGGAAFIEGAFIATNTDFIYNFANGAHGGGAIATDVAHLTLTDCLFDDNHALTTTEGGGALFCSETDLTMNGCTLQNNNAMNSGGAMYQTDGEAWLIDCTFTANFLGPDLTGDLTGGAIANMMLSTLTMSGCDFMNNTAIVGGGAVFNDSSSTVEITQCTFFGNDAQGPYGGGKGGALFSNGGGVTVAETRFEANFAHVSAGAAKGTGTYVNCTFVDNTSDGPGGAINAGQTEPHRDLTIMNCRFHGNEGVGPGGAVSCTVHEDETCLIAGCAFSGNSIDCESWQGGGAIHIQNGWGGSCKVVNCSFWSNSATFNGGAIDTNGVVAISNCIFWDNIPEQLTYDSDAHVSYCDVQGDWQGPGSNNIDADPWFADPYGPDNIPGTEDDDLRLLSGSPCIDAADNTAVPPDTLDLDGDSNTSEPIPFDLDGNPRFIDDPDTADTGVGYPCVDMGAYEYPSCKEDINRDGEVDIDDLFEILAHWNEGAGRYDVNSDGVVDIDDIFAVLAAWGPCP